MVTGCLSPREGLRAHGPIFSLSAIRTTSRPGERNARGMRIAVDRRQGVHGYVCFRERDCVEKRDLHRAPDRRIRRNQVHDALRSGSGCPGIRCRLWVEIQKRQNPLGRGPRGFGVSACDAGLRQEPPPGGIRSAHTSGRMPQARFNAIFYVENSHVGSCGSDIDPAAFSTSMICSRRSVKDSSAFCLETSRGWGSWIAASLDLERRIRPHSYPDNFRSLRGV